MNQLKTGSSFLFVCVNLWIVAFSPSTHSIREETKTLRINCDKCKNSMFLRATNCDCDRVEKELDRSKGTTQGWLSRHKNDKRVMQIVSTSSGLYITDGVSLWERLSQNLRNGFENIQSKIDQYSELISVLTLLLAVTLFVFFLAVFTFAFGPFITIIASLVVPLTLLGIFAVPVLIMKKQQELEG